MPRLTPRPSRLRQVSGRIGGWSSDAMAPGAIASAKIRARSSSDQRRRGSPRVTTSTTDRRLLEGVLSRALSVTASSTTAASSSLQRRKGHDQWVATQGGGQTAVTPNRPTTHVKQKSQWAADNGYGNGSLQPGSPAEVAGGRGMTPGVCLQRASGDKKSPKIAMFRLRQR